MKDIREAYNDTYYGDYQPLLDSFEHEILLQVDDDDYQGDSRLILRDGERHGLLIYGWGSCSGCDALQACDSIEEVGELRDSLYGAIHWEASAQALHDYIKAKDWELEYCWHHNETKEFLKKAVELLAK